MSRVRFFPNDGVIKPSKRRGKSDKQLAKLNEAASQARKDDWSKRYPELDADETVEILGWEPWEYPKRWAEYLHRGR